MIKKLDQEEIVKSIEVMRQIHLLEVQDINQIIQIITMVIIIKKECDI